MGSRSMIAERAFSQRVLERIKRAEHERRRSESLRYFVPLALIVILGGTWAVALFDGIIALRMVIEIVALVVAIGNLEQRLGSALLGPFAPIPLVVCFLLFVAAIGWVRTHQPDAPSSPT